MQVCPMCGRWVADEVTECTGCGENLAGKAAPEVRFGLEKVRTGVTLMYHALQLTALTIIIVIALRIAAPDVAIKFMSAVPWILLGLAIVSLVGKCFLIGVPGESGTKGIIITAVVFSTFGVIAPIISLAGNQMIDPRMLWWGAFQFFGVLIILWMLAYLAFWVGFMILLIFFKQLSKYMADSDLEKRATASLIYFVLMVGSFLAAMFVPETVPLPATVAIGLAIIVFSLMTLLRYSRLLYDFRKAL